MRTSLNLSARSESVVLLIGFWTLVGILYASMGFAARLVFPGEVTGSFRPAWVILSWWTWVPTTLIAVAFVQRFPVDRHRWYRHVLVHLVGAVVCSLFACALFASMRGAEALVLGERFAFLAEWRAVFARSVAIDSVVYLTVLVAVHAFDYYKKYRARTLQAERLQVRLARTQLHALSLQLRPHFLFNTFHTIAVLVREHEEQKATETIARLSDFLRYVLDNDGVQEVTLQQEIDFLESYVAIERARFEHAIELHIEADPAALRGRVPTLILQPLIENALRHGLRGLPVTARLHVRARRAGGRLHLHVRDNGRGLPEGWSLEACGGIGLTNTRERLRQLYGADHHFALAERPEGGVEVSIALPYRPLPAGGDLQERPPYRAHVRERLAERDLVLDEELLADGEAWPEGDGWPDDDRYLELR